MVTEGRGPATPRGSAAFGRDPLAYGTRGPGDGADDGGAPRDRFDLQRAAEQVGPVPHDAEAECSILAVLRVVSRSIVVDHQPQAIAVARERDHHLAPATLSGGVGDGLLRDAVEVRRDDAVRDLERPVLLEGAGHPEQPLGADRELPNRGGEPMPLE